MKIRYIGNFPPPYGGVTIKNRLLYDTLKEHMSIRYFEKPGWMPGKCYQGLQIMSAFLPRQQLIIGVSAKGGKSRTLTRMLYRLNRKSMKSSIYFMMGGQECYRIAESKDEINWYSKYQQIYVETESMKQCLVKAGLDNVSVFPNCRKRPQREPVFHERENDRLQGVFFSLISEEKGVDILLEAARDMPDVDFSFYGHIEESYEVQFKKQVDLLPNVTYKGIFKGRGEEVYQELGKYDVLLLPTKWKNEGVPGILIEAKIAGLALIVSDRNYNKEIVKDKEEGFVLPKNSAKEVQEALLKLACDDKLLYNIRKNSYYSAERYYIDNYTDSIAAMLLQKKRK